MKVIKNLKRKFFRSDTAFPELDEEHIPELASISSYSSDEESVERRRKLYHTKEEEDVAVFLQIAQRMSHKSLIFLLQNHARTTLGIAEADLIAAMKQESLHEKLPTVPKVKKFRFAEVQNNTIRQVVQEFERVPDPENHWWTGEEFYGIRLEAAQLVRFYRKHEAQFIACVDSLTLSDIPDHEMDASMKYMLANPMTRGLENQMSPAMKEGRKRTVQAVLEMQEKCKGMKYEEACECLRKAALPESRPCRTYAARMGDFDHLEALKALTARWRKPSQMPLKPTRSVSPPQARSAAETVL